MDVLEIIKEMKSLPKGTLVFKKIKGKEQPYLQWTENGKTKSKYIKIEERKKIISQLERRKYLKESFDRITEDITKSDSILYVADDMACYNAVKQEQPLISKKEISSSEISWLVLEPRKTILPVRLDIYFSPFCTAFALNKYNLYKVENIRKHPLRNVTET